MIIGLSGKKRVGKDTCGHYLELKYGFQRIAFADHLKKIAKKVGWDGKKDVKGRRLLQVLGEVVRDYNEQYWVDQVLATIQKKAREGYTDFVITDMRFPNEVAWLREVGGVAVRVYSEDEITNDLHKSETALDNYDGFFARIESRRGDFDHLYQQLDKVYETVVGLSVAEQKP